MLTKNLEAPWARLQPDLTIRTERDYDAAIQHLNELLGEIGDNQRHPLYGLLDTLCTLIVQRSQHRVLARIPQRWRPLPAAAPDSVAVIRQLRGAIE